MTGSLALTERNVPRYTSYPSAPHFTAAVGPDTYRDWLAALPAGSNVSLYIHVPFCTELCFYCGCNTRAVRKRAPVDAYAENLIQEIALLGDLNGAGSPICIGAAARRRSSGRNGWRPSPASWRRASICPA